MRGVSATQLRVAQDRFVAAWGQMGSNWGISRTMAEVHALLYITGDGLNTDEVMERLSISRGNASMSLRALVEWGLAQRVHRRKDRKEYFEAEQDPWALMRKVVRERVRRELHPALALLFEARDLTNPETRGSTDAASASATEISPVDASAGGGSASGDAEALTLQVERHNQRLDQLLELLQTVDRLAERFVGAEGKGLRLAASVLSRIP
jgi:DNA-binding transcriptional regulator GbsR (MarR family)